MVIDIGLMRGLGLETWASLVREAGWWRLFWYRFQLSMFFRKLRRKEWHLSVVMLSLAVHWWELIDHFCYWVHFFRELIGLCFAHILAVSGAYDLRTIWPGKSPSLHLLPDLSSFCKNMRPRCYCFFASAICSLRGLNMILLSLCEFMA
jgi:hypothetical protein